MSLREETSGAGVQCGGASKSQAMLLGSIKQGLLSGMEEVTVLLFSGLASPPPFWICAFFRGLATSSSQNDLCELKI